MTGFVAHRPEEAAERGRKPPPPLLQSILEGVLSPLKGSWPQVPAGVDTSLEPPFSLLDGHVLAVRSDPTGATHLGKTSCWTPRGSMCLVRQGADAVSCVVGTVEQ
jgi:hypothetical protein